MFPSLMHQRGPPCFCFLSIDQIGLYFEECDARMGVIVETESVGTDLHVEILH
jgi:hypothetical protein